jgi:hypothetical protein
VAAYGQHRTRPPPSRIIRGLDDESSDADEITPVDCGPETKVYFRVDEAVEIKEYMREALKAMQQRNCKLICKTWIQAFEPSKQTKFPYSANKKNDENRRSCRPETPYWWPPNIPHTEPDHLRLSGAYLRPSPITHVKTNMDKIEFRFSCIWSIVAKG